MTVTDDAIRRSSRSRQVVMLAARHHGVLSLAELMSCGLSARAIQHRERAGTLRRLHLGVYLVGPLLTEEGRWRAAVLAGGSGAVLSHAAAARLWGFGGPGQEIAVTVPARRRVASTVRTHASRTMTAPDRTRRRGIPVTTVARTLIDRAGELDRGGLERELHEAQVLKLLNVRVLCSAIERAGPRRGIGTLRHLLDDAVRGPTRSELERDFARLARHARLPPHHRNATLRLQDRVIQADAYWPEARLVVELDGRSVHDTSRAFFADRDRDLDVALGELLTVRLTKRHLRDETDRTARRLRRLIAMRSDRHRGRQASPVTVASASAAPHQPHHPA